MENSQQPLATESFSYSWLTHKPPHTFRQFEDDDDFRFQVSSSPAALVNADEIFSEGQIMAVYSRTSSSVPSSPLGGGGRNPSCCVLRKWRKILRKCLGFVNRSVGWPRKSIRVDDLQRKVLELRSLESSPRQSSSSVELMDNLEYGFEFMKIEKNWRISPRHSPHRSRNYVCCEADDSSIREAILYCKRSIEN